MSTHPRHDLDEIIHAPVRLSIMAALAAADRADFRFLKETIEVSDSLLSKHMLILEEAGYVKVSKGFVGKRPRTSLSLTDEGKAAFATCTAVLQQVERGRLQLDAPVEQYLPGLLPDRRVTVRMLLNHTSHIGDYGSALITSPDSLEEIRVRQFTEEELLKLGLGVGASGEPGESPGSYSNTNYIVLGLLLDGMATLSLSTEDGGKQASSGINMTWHPGTEAGQQAWVVHAVGAMCGTNRIAASDVPRLLIDAGTQGQGPRYARPRP